MTTIKSHTDLSQSKVLAEILPLESADMCYTWDFEDEQYYINTEKFSNWRVPKYAESAKHKQVIPAWSLAALLGVLPKGTRLLKSATDNTYHCDCPKGNTSRWFDNPVDACVAMIELLHEQKLL